MFLYFDSTSYVMEIELKMPDLKKFLNTYTIALCIIILGFLIIGSINLGNRIPDWDESAHYGQAKIILHPDLYKLCAIDPQHCDIYPPKDFLGIPVPMYVDHPPFGKYIFAAALAVNESIESGRFLILLFGAALIFATYMLGKNFYSRKSGLLATVLTAISIAVANYSRQMFPDVPLTFFLVSGILFFWFGSKNIKFAVIAGILAGLAILTKEPGLAILLPIAYISLTRYMSVKANIKEFSFDFKFSEKEKKNNFFIAIIVMLLVGIILYNVIGLMLYGSVPLLKNFEYHSAVGKFSGKNIDIIGYLGSMNAIVVLFPITLIAVIFFALRRKTEDIVILLAFIPFFIYTFTQGANNEFFKNPGWLHYLVVMVPFLSIMTAEFLLFVRSRWKTPVLIGIVIILAIAYLFLFYPYYFPTDKAEIYRPAIAELETRISKDTPMLTSYNSLAMRYYFGWKETHAIETMNTDQIRLLILQNINRTSFNVLIQSDWEKYNETRKSLEGICPQQEIVINQEEVFIVYLC